MHQTNRNYNPLQKEDYSQGYMDNNFNYYKIPKYPTSTKDYSNARLNQETYNFIKAKNFEEILINNIKNTPDERNRKRKNLSLFPTPKENLTFIENYRYKANKSYITNNGEEDSQYISIGSNNSHKNSGKEPYTSAQEKFQTIQHSDSIKLNKKKEEDFKMEKNTKIEEKLDEIKNGLFYFWNKIEDNLNKFFNKFKDENQKLIKAQREEYCKLINKEREENKYFLVYLAKLMGIKLDKKQLDMKEFPRFF